ncbi:hypothetical protein C7S18_10325 [Ahniella affigens]|uniref:Uncharacterized protein n=1 Tax=Ahniella affigens TaxID=2021234 RepID=A0A2P1PRT6_9GAMM|nr:hypothetical protein C7S18_10325 [Ahniella affigens]
MGGDFKTVALLDEHAYLASMVYADLNTIRAQMTNCPKKSDHTGIQKRIRLMTGDQPRHKRGESLVQLRQGPSTSVVS